METVERVLREELGNPRAVFVFPTEVASRFWLRRCFDLTSRRTLPLTRFLSWDQFVETALDYGGLRRPATRATRTLFAWGLLEANRRKPFLRQLVSPEMAGEPFAFARSLRNLLPHLHGLPGLRSAWPAFSAGRAEDLAAVHREYLRCLAEAGLYEPAFEKPALRAGDRRYFLFYPEVLEEYSGLEGLLSGHPQVALVHLSLEPPASVPSIDACEDSILEVRRALSAIAALLDRGADPEAIVLTVADLPSLEPALRRQAELYAVPLAVHLGRGVTSFPPCRLFRRIQACLDARFSQASLRDLLLDRSLPWREESLARSLIRLAREDRVLKNAPEEDRWERALRNTRRRENPGGLPLERLRSFYRRLKRSLLDIAQASGLRAAKEALTQFSKTLLDSSRWEEAELKAFQFALNTLDDLEEASRFAPALPQSPYRLWLEYLEDTPYVPQTPRVGVPVYAYRVSGLIYPEHHFLINCSQAFTRHRVKRYPFLSAPEEEALGLEEAERDLSDLHLQLYCLSGRDVGFSYARRDYTQSHLPPGFFVARGRVRRAEAGEGPTDPYRAEAESWAGRSPLPAQLLPLQLQGFRNALPTVLAGKSLDASRTPLRAQELIRSLRQRLSDAQGRLRISATSLETFAACPLRYLLERALGLSDEALSPVSLEPMEFGSIMHRIFQRFYRMVQSRQPGSPLSREQAETYRRWMRLAVRAVLRAWARRNPVPIAPVWGEVRRKAFDLADCFLERELEEMSGTRVLDTERHLESQREGMVLSGTIDRLSEDELGLILVDYKKRRTPRGSEIFGEEPVSFQLPFYLELMADGGRPVSSAAYYSIEEARYRWVLGGRGGLADEQALEDTLRRLRARIASMADRIASGDFSLPDPYGGDCSRCTQGEICRRRYALR